MTELVLPRSGLNELLRGWTGDGKLINALAAVADDNSWTASDIRRRARIVALAQMGPDIQQLPTTVKQWGDILPQMSRFERLVSGSVRGGVRWAETARRFGWPPTEYVTRNQRRVPDELALTTLAWISQELNTFLEDAGLAAPALRQSQSAQAAALATAVSELGGVAPIRPDRTDLLSLRASGAPWPVVTRIASAIHRCNTNPSHLAYELLAPDPLMQSRLFHLCVFGELLRTLRLRQMRISWRSPIGGMRPGPRAVARDESGTTWDIWFEAAGARSHYLLPRAAYSDAVSGISGAGFPIGVDVALVSPTRAALLLECKWSSNISYVARDGFHQAVSYAFDARHGMAEQVWSFIVGPEEIVPTTSVSEAFLEASDVVVGSTAVPLLAEVVGEFLAAAA